MNFKILKLKSLKSRLIWFHHLDKNFVDRFLAIIASLEVLESRREYLWWPSSRRNWRVRSRSESTFFLMASDFFWINSWKERISWNGFFRPLCWPISLVFSWVRNIEFRKLAFSGHCADQNGLFVLICTTYKHIEKKQMQKQKKITGAWSLISIFLS